jgi:hypothetical protein
MTITALYKPAVLCRALVVVGVGMATTTTAQTNSSVAHTRYFNIPTPQLRTLDTNPPSSRTGLQQGEVALRSWPVETRLVDLRVPLSHPLALVGKSDDEDFRLPYGRYHDFDSIIIRPAKVPADPVTRVLYSVFRPEEFHVGRTTVSCSILTAIKRKNPLCLLNPLVLSVSW